MGQVVGREMHTQPFQRDPVMAPHCPWHCSSSQKSGCRVLQHWFCTSWGPQWGLVAASHSPSLRCPSAHLSVLWCRLLAVFVHWVGNLLMTFDCVVSCNHQKSFPGVSITPPFYGPPFSFLLPFPVVIKSTGDQTTFVVSLFLTVYLRHIYFAWILIQK